ncbi:unnamed protein product, partial [Ascophyllum nodosum]
VKEGSPPTCSSFPCATYDPPLLRLLSEHRREVGRRGGATSGRQGLGRCSRGP